MRNAKTSTFDLRVRDEDALTNLPLQQRLRDDFGIELPELEIEEDWKPSDYFTEVQRVTSSRDRWKFDPNAMQLGFFSFSKLLMYRDLAIEAWPDEALANHALTRGLLYEGFEREEPLFASSDKLDDVLPPEKLFHVVDADASQAKVIEEVRSGRNLVVQGPPGTGKSQTITNIIAAAAKEGKRVLFLAEKMAALSVVHDRLVKVGLRDVCLELHSRSENKKAVLSELARTLSQASVVPEVPAAPTAVKESRDRLNNLAGAIHRPIGATGETAYSVLGRQSQFIGKGIAPPSLEVESLSSMSRQQEIDLLATIEEYGAFLVEEGRATIHPFEGTGNLHLQPVDLARLKATLTEAQAAVTSLAASLRLPVDTLALHVTAALDIVAPLADVLGRLEGLPLGAANIAQKVLDAPDIPRLRQALRAGMAWREALDQASEVFVETAFSISSSHLRAPLAAGIRSFFARWGGRYRGASRELAGLLRGSLPKTAAERVERIDQWITLVSLRSEWEGDRENCGRILGDAWRGEKSDFGRLVAIVEWCERLSKAPISVRSDKSVALAARADSLAAMRLTLQEAAQTARSALQAIVKLLDLNLASFGDLGLEHTDLATVAARFGAMAATGRYTSWTQLARRRDALASAGLSRLEERMRSGELDGAAAAIELRYSRAERLWKFALEQDPDLRGIGLERRHDLVDTFATLERQQLRDNVTTILAGHLAQVPQGAMGEMKVLRGEIGKRRGLRSGVGGRRG
ncbi:AAA family ATPase [Bradyrhizobium diazoefficiens]|nr:AAA family ATPase [Bradyrhizobium diazoefficiens]